MAGSRKETQRPHAKLSGRRHSAASSAEKDPLREGSLLEGIRLNRYLAQRGVCSRRAADRLIEEGRVEINQRVVRQLGTLVNTARDDVYVDGELVSESQAAKVLLFHKPVGVLSTCRRSREVGPIILDYLPSDHRYFPVGRLDKDSAGLLIITDDGELANLLMHPRYGAHKVYRVEIDPPLPRRQIALLTKGVVLDDGPARALSVKEIDPQTLDVTLGEGRKRQLRRMIRAIGADVVSLTRIEHAGLKLGNIKSGRWRELSAREIDRLKHSFSDSPDNSPAEE